MLFMSAHFPKVCCILNMHVLYLPLSQFTAYTKATLLKRRHNLAYVEFVKSFCIVNKKSKKLSGRFLHQIAGKFPQPPLLH